MTNILRLITITFLLLGFNTMYANNTDSTKVRKNIIRWNLTPVFVVGPKSIVLGYERVLKNNQSFSFNMGYLETTPFTNREGDPIQFFDESKKGGMDMSIDYRFYFKKRNKFPAPDGLYWGPYASYYGIWQDASMNLIDNNTIKNTTHVKGRLNMYNFGLQLGYQFIIKNRFSIDLILMGPSFSYYDMKMDLNFHKDIDVNDPFYKDLMEAIGTSYPAIAQFIKNKSFEASGRLKFGYYGFRYGIQLGYLF